MNPSHDLEPRIADYYATEAPSRAPDWLLVRALDTIATTPQRRIGPRWPWRFPPVRHVAKLVVGAIAILAITASGLTVLRLPTVGPAALTSSEPLSSAAAQQPPPLTERFDSALNGISMDYPAGWQTRPATEPWTSRALYVDEPGVDIILDPTLGEDLYILLASEPLGGRPSRSWPASVVNYLCGAKVPEGWAGYTLSLDPWLPNDSSSWPRCMFVTTDTRGYAIALHVGDERLADTYSYDWFQSVLETVDLRPDEAVSVSPPPLSERFDSTSNGISMSYPAGWQTSPAWTGTFGPFGASSNDYIFDPELRERLYLAVVSEPLDGRADHEWLGEYLALACDSGEGGDGGYTLTLDGASGWVTHCAGAPILTVTTDTRGYAIALHLGDERLADTYSDDWFQSVLETVDLHPEEAAAAANPSSSANVVP